MGDVLQQPLAVQPPPVEQPGEVPLTGVAQAGHHRVAGAQVFGDLVRGRHVQAGRGADVEAELVQKSERLGAKASVKNKQTVEVSLHKLS